MRNKVEALEEDEEPSDNPDMWEPHSFNRFGSSVLSTEKNWLETDDIEEF
jgi:hypothetical protein